MYFVGEGFFLFQCRDVVHVVLTTFFGQIFGSYSLKNRQNNWDKNTKYRYCLKNGFFDPRQEHDIHDIHDIKKRFIPMPKT